MLLALLPPARTLARRSLLLWALLGGPYLLWCFVGQNITVKPRHILPLVALLLVLCAAMAMARRWRGRGSWPAPLAAAGLLLWIGGQAASGALLVQEHAVVPSNAVLMARDVARYCASDSAAAPTKLVVYTSTFQRHFQRHAACAEVVQVRRSSHVKRDLASRQADTLAFVVSDVGRINRLRRPPWRRYRRNRYVQNARNSVDLYRIGAADGE